VATTFTFNRGSFDGPVRTFHPTGFIHDRETNAEWRMQFLWPFKAAFLVLYLDDTYETTIIGVPNRKYVWVMARTPTIPEEKYRDLVAFLESVGYDTAKLQRVPQRPAR
jgi:apolipoprotein D and lipocalin family protein